MTFQYIRRRPHIILGSLNPFTADWKLLNGVYTAGDKYSRLSSVRWMYANTPHGDEYLYELRNQDRYTERAEDETVGEQINMLLTWSLTRRQNIWERLSCQTEELYYE